MTSRFIPGKDPLTIVQKAGWALGFLWMGAQNLIPTGIQSTNIRARNESLYRLSYPGWPTTHGGEDKNDYKPPSQYS